MLHHINASDNSSPQGITAAGTQATPTIPPTPKRQRNDSNSDTIFPIFATSASRSRIQPIGQTLDGATPEGSVRHGSIAAFLVQSNRLLPQISGLQQSNAEPKLCLTSNVTTLLYVDDPQKCNSREKAEEVKKLFKGRYGMAYLGPARRFLGRNTDTKRQASLYIKLHVSKAYSDIST